MLKSEKKMSETINSFVTKVMSISTQKATGKCALHIRIGLEAAGFNFARQPSAYMYANGTLSGIGFNKIASGTTLEDLKSKVFKRGDIVVYDRSKNYPHGHIQVYTGTGWVSDFRQRYIYIYTKEILPWTLWRHNSVT